MTTPGRSGRLHRLETRWHQSTTCPTCRDYPRRLVIEDADTGHVISENVPESGCPDCGRPIMFTRTYLLAGDDPDDQKGRDSRRWTM